VLLPDDDIHGAAAVAERLRAAVEACTVSTETGPVRFTISLGVITLRAEDTLADLALQRADEALYAAKGSGRNRVCLHPSDTRRPALTGETPPD
jgi:diguanylate cyclase (GGDEF)-like protein